MSLLSVRARSCAQRARNKPRDTRKIERDQIWWQGRVAIRSFIIKDTGSAVVQWLGHAASTRKTRIRLPMVEPSTTGDATRLDPAHLSTFEGIISVSTAHLSTFKGTISDLLAHLSTFRLKICVGAAHLNTLWKKVLN